MSYWNEVPQDLIDELPERQRLYVQCVREGMTVPEVSEQEGVHERSVWRQLAGAKKKLSLKGFSPEHDMTKTVPDGYMVKGTSTLYDKDGNTKLQWVKSSVDRERQLEIMQEAIRALCEDLPKIKKTKAPKNATADMMAIYPLGDPHIGVLSWAEETGQDWDLKIAEQAFCGAFDRIVKTTPKCETATIVNLGDFFHADNMAGVTERSGHQLDMDGRYAKMIRIGVKIIKRMIISALEHHKKVNVINAIGNHDDTGALFLSVSLAEMFENEPRVTIDSTPAPFHYFRFGNSLYGVHHGHTCKAANLPSVMATDQPKLWGDTVYRTWLTGHIHHDTKKEYGGCVVESFRTLAAKDAYATWGGYRALQDTKALVVHKDYGEIERHTVNLSMIGME